MEYLEGGEIEDGQSVCKKEADFRSVRIMEDEKFYEIRLALYNASGMKLSTK